MARHIYDKLTKNKYANRGFPFPDGIVKGSRYNKYVIMTVGTLKRKFYTEIKNAGNNLPAWFVATC